MGPVEKIPQTPGYKIKTQSFRDNIRILRLCVAYFPPFISINYLLSIFIFYITLRSYSNKQ